MAEMTNKKTSDKIKWEDLLLQAAREIYGRRVWLRRSWFTDRDKEEFLKALFSDAKNINPRDPVEISKNTVDVNEKIYANHEGSEDETTVKIVSCVENSEGHNYQETTTKGVQWGASANIGLQFGLPQVGVGATGGLGANFQRTRTLAISNEKTTSNKVELQSHHEEVVKIPPGKKVIVKMTSYRVRYKLEYTMEYKIAKTARIHITFDPCGLGLPCLSHGALTPQQLMNDLPGFREDEEFAYFTQEGELRWVADRMEVEKTVVPV